MKFYLILCLASGDVCDWIVIELALDNLFQLSGRSWNVLHSETKAFPQ